MRLWQFLSSFLAFSLVQALFQQSKCCSLHFLALSFACTLELSLLSSDEHWLQHAIFLCSWGTGLVSDKPQHRNQLSAPYQQGFLGARRKLLPKYALSSRNQHHPEAKLTTE